MLNTPDDIPGFTHPGPSGRLHGRRSAIAAQLVATLALIVAIAIAAVAVSMEIAEAGVLNSVRERPAQEHFSVPCAGCRKPRGKTYQR